MFDCDGVLADTDDAWAEAERMLCERHAGLFTDELRASTHGLSMRDTVVRLAAHMAVPPATEQLEAELIDLAAERIQAHLVPLPGAVDLVTTVAAALPVAVASNTPRAILNVILGSIGLLDRLDTSLAGDEVTHPKPASDIYVTAAARLGVTPAEVVVIEDSPTGVRAARLAGCRVLGVEAPGRPRLADVEASFPDLPALANHLQALLPPAPLHST
ncbi:HAD family hydrolase [Micromonospora echinaurantiaca]|uniref:HAD family hydrolase n=1 Tax=Micromonospora echinaurantiaca TaxID=47857 RepID=UPI00379C7BDA